MASWTMTTKKPQKSVIVHWPFVLWARTKFHWANFLRLRRPPASRPGLVGLGILLSCTYTTYYNSVWTVIPSAITFSPGFLKKMLPWGEWETRPEEEENLGQNVQVQAVGIFFQFFIANIFLAPRRNVRMDKPGKLYRIMTFDLAIKSDSKCLANF